MKIDNHNSINTKQSFKAGLNKFVKEQAEITNPVALEQLFNDTFNIEASFKDNKSAAFANSTCIKLLSNIAEKIKLKFFSPPAIYIYNRENIINKNDANNFCIQDTKEVLKNDYPFPGRSIFFKDFENFEEINNGIEILYDKKISSSNHFLAPFIHEWLHSIHLDMIYSKLGYGGACSYLNEVYPVKNNKLTGIELIKQLETKKLSKKENDVIFDMLGEYSTRGENQYLEIFAEAFTKFICKSLNGNLEVVKNPFDIIKTTSKDFQKILNKVCNVQNIEM